MHFIPYSFRFTTKTDFSLLAICTLLPTLCTKHKRKRGK
uniref:Uncharacterized protein n=1 Tax=Arundo donax TaxID=35708 RepID=A0A0A8Z6R2_ARUDO